ncbi:MAG TPA: hypothetical protein VFY76_18430 [Nocardioides sp.]|nr:hypothetical protein [Nocardioides sp.]
MNTAVPPRWYAGWLLSFLGFPLGGLPAVAIGGIDDLGSAILGGGAAGLVIGAAQGLALGRLPVARAHADRSPQQLLIRWSALSALGLAAGLAIGSAVVGYGTSASDLVTQGLISGAGIGTAQAWAGRPWFGRRFAAVWMPAVTALWPLGWTVTRLAGVSVEDRFAVFGATGALTFTALSGLVLVSVAREHH